MEQVATILEQLRQFSVQHAPGGVPTGAIPVALFFLIIGVALSVVGARFARFGMTSVFVLLGGVLGQRFAESFDYSQPICIPVGSLLFGIIGFQTFKVWVGAAIAFLLSMLVVSGFGAKNIVPHFVDYSETSPLNIGQPELPGDTQFTIPTRDEQSAYVNGDPRTWLTGFWKFLTERDPGLARNTQALGILTALCGLCVGLMAVRPSLIVSTSLIGTAMVATGVMTLLSSSVTSTYESIQANPRLIGLGVAAFLATSLVLQTMLMRKTTLGDSAPKKG